MEMSASEFKAKCLDIFDQLAARRIDRLVVTKRGRPVAVLTPPESPADQAEALFGLMRGTVIAPDGLDLTAPVLEESPSALEGWTDR